MGAMALRLLGRDRYQTDDEWIVKISREMTWRLKADDLMTTEGGCARLSAQVTIDAGSKATLDDMNLLITAVPGYILTRRDYWRRSFHTLGFSMFGGTEGKVFRWSSDKLTTSFEGQAHTDLYELLGNTSYGGDDGLTPIDGVYNERFGPEQPVTATAFLELTSANGTDSLAAEIRRLSYLPPVDDERFLPVRISAFLWMLPTPTQTQIGIEPAQISFTAVVNVTVDVIPLANETLSFNKSVNIKRSLCIQPVKIEVNDRETGVALDFVKKEVEAQWGKVDVVFSYRDWRIVRDPRYFEIEAADQNGVLSKEEKDLLGEVNVADCIEVYFVAKFKPSSAHGGGFTFSPGTANAKVVISDEIVECPGMKPGVQKSVLAHRLGHVLGLGHPIKDASSGTLMCPSGWKVDNPERNSMENGQNLMQPLLKWSRQRSPKGVPDCKGNADCGTCQEHMGPSC